MFHTLNLVWPVHNVSYVIGYSSSLVIVPYSYKSKIPSEISDCVSHEYKNYKKKMYNIILHFIISIGTL